MTFSSDAGMTELYTNLYMIVYKAVNHKPKASWH